MAANINLQNSMIPDAVTGTWYEAAPKAAAGAPALSIQKAEATTAAMSKNNATNKNGVLRFLSKWLH